MARTNNYKLTNLKINTEIGSDRNQASSQKYGGGVGIMSPLGSYNQIGTTFSPKISKKTESDQVYPGYPQYPESTVRSISKGRGKSELNLESKFYSGSTFSPKTTKGNFKGTSNSLNKYMPLSTRNTSGYAYNHNGK